MGKFSKFGKVVKEERLKNRLTATECAKRLGITYVQLNNVESGRCLPKINTLDKYASVLGYDVDDLTQIWIEDYGTK